MSFYDDASLVLIPSGVKTAKVYSQKPTNGSGDLTFTRASIATRVNSAGLIEKVRTNLLLQSNTFSNASWVKDGTTLTGGQAGYDGTNNAWLLDKIANQFRFINQLVTISGTYVFSVYAKANTLDKITLRDSSSQAVEFNLSTGTIVSQVNGAVGRIVSVGGGWYRCSVVMTTTNPSPQIYPDWNGSTAGNILIQNAQVETGDVASDYIPTTTAAVTVGPTNNVPRLEYMTATGALATCPMLEAEQQRTNLLLQSEAFNNAYWEKGSAATVTANTVISPDGTQNADTLTANGSGEIFVRKNIYSGTAQTCNNSVFVKKANNRYVGLRNTGSPSGAHDVFDFDTKTWTNNSGATLSYDELGNGWFRLKSTNTEPVRLNYYWSVIPALNTSGAETGTVSNLSVYIWGAQAEQNVSFPSTYIPTTTATVTRLKDDISISGASALIGQTEGTIFLDVDFRVVSSGGIRTFFGLEGSVVNQFTGFSVTTQNNGNDIFFASTAYTLTQGRHKIVCRYNSTTNVSKLFVDGAQRGASTFAAFASTIDRISILGRINPFSSFTIDRQQFGGCNQFVLFKTALSDAQCIELSTL